MSEDKVDLHLIREVQLGNKQAFDALVIKYQYKVFKLVARYVSDPSEVLDVTQEAFIRAYRGLDTFRGESSFYTWLYRIATNTAKNYVVSQGRKLPEQDYEISELEQYITKSNIKECITPERTIISNEIEHILFELIEALPSDLRTAIMLREVDGLTYDEIASVMECPVGTVRSRIFRAREAIERKAQQFIQK